jgi:hypothetical protein
MKIELLFHKIQLFKVIGYIPVALPIGKENKKKLPTYSHTICTEMAKHLETDALV